jgi:hypothetical protein
MIILTAAFERPIFFHLSLSYRTLLLIVAVGIALHFGEATKEIGRYHSSSTPIRFGEAFEREARRLYREKPSFQYVVKLIDISPTLASRLARGQKSKRETKRDHPGSSS